MWYNVFLQSYSPKSDDLKVDSEQLLVSNCSAVILYGTNMQADHLSEIPGISGSVRDFDNCQEKILPGKSGQKLFIVSRIFASVQVFSSIQLVAAWYEYPYT